MHNAQFWIKHLELEPHPEGGYFKEVYRSEGSFTPTKIGATRNYATSIYFLIESGNVSHFHSILQDEIWYYHAGDPLVVHILNEDGSHNEIQVGPHPDCGQHLQTVVPASSIFGSTTTGEFSLVSCMVAPGFDFNDFKLYKKSELLAKFPQHKAIIEVLGVE